MAWGLTMTNGTAGLTAVPEAVRATAGPRVIPLRKNWTEPVGVPAWPEETVVVKVAVWPV